MTSTTRFIVTAMLLALVATACGGSVSEPSNNIDPSLEGQWAITGALDGDGEFVTPLPTTTPVARFSTDGMTGNTGCNTFFGTVDALPDGSWNSSEIGMTLIGCPPDLADQEQAITNAIASATQWSRDGDQMRLSAASIDLMALERWEIDLTSTEWSVTGINNGRGGVGSRLAGTDPRIVFGEGGRMAATAGCNDLAAAYAADDSTISIEAVAATKKLCTSPEGVMDQEQQMAQALAAAATYEINGAQLTIRDNEGSTQITAVPVDE